MRFIVLTFLFLTFACAASSSKVDVVLYAEALCPYCAAALRDVIGPLLEGGLGDRIDFRYVAWGNARNFSVRLKQPPPPTTTQGTGAVAGWWVGWGVCVGGVSLAGWFPVHPCGWGCCCRTVCAASTAPKSAA